MTTLTTETNATATETFSPEATAYIAQLEKRIADQQKIMDRASSIMLEAVLSDDGIDPDAADKCMDAIRGAFTEVGKTTTEQYLQDIYDRIGAAAGFASNTEFNPLHVIDQMRTVIAVQSRNGALVEWQLRSTWVPGSKTKRPRMLVSRAGKRQAYRYFPIGTDWLTALQAIMKESKQEQAA